MEDFNNCFNKCGLVELKSLGVCMSWSNGHEGQNRSWAKLDKALVNVHFINRFELVRLEYTWQEKLLITNQCYCSYQNVLPNMGLPLSGIKICGVLMKNFLFLCNGFGLNPFKVWN